MVRDCSLAIASWLGSQWLSTLVASPAGDENSDVVAAFVAAPRHVGRDRVSSLSGKHLRGPDDDIAVDSWTSDVAARVAILCAIAASDPAAIHDLVDALFREGDNREKSAIVRALCLLPEPLAYLPVALEAGRTNDTQLFAALACDNPYPARHYPELELNKLVMKAAFVGAPIDRIVGLSGRANPELSRMAMEYIDEQEHARRRFPPEIFAVIGAHPRPGSIARMLGYLNHSIAENRMWAARGLGLCGDPRVGAFLRERLDIEQDGPVRAVIAKVVES